MKSMFILFNLLQIGLTASTIAAFSINDRQTHFNSQSVVFSKQLAYDENNSNMMQSRRSFLPVVGASVFGIITSPTLSHASSGEEVNGKYIILNNAPIGSNNVDEGLSLEPMTVVDSMSTLWNKIEAKYSQNGLVDYISVGSDADFRQIEKEMTKLRNISMKSMDNPAKMAFVINLYNTLIRVAFVTAGIPKNDLTRLSFFDTVAVNVGGDVFTFNDLENGILRSNSVPPYHLTKPFGKGDRRMTLALPATDPRIHFCLNCGAKSCPLVRHYSANELEKELQAAAEAFCEDNSNVYIDESKGELLLSKIFKWYMPDFANSKEQLPSQILKYLNGKKLESLKQLVQKNESVKVDFINYDWTTNDSASKKFG